MSTDAAAPTGLLFFARGGVVPSTPPAILRFARPGGVTELGVLGGAPRLSPNGKLLVYYRDRDLWIFDLERGFEEPLLFEGSQWIGFAWSPDSRRIVFSSDHEGPWSLYTRSVDGSDQPTRVVRTGQDLIAASWSQSGWITYVATTWDIWVVQFTQNGAGEPRLFLGSEDTEWFPAMSPDERWMAYVSDKTGENQIYIRPFPGPGPARRVSIHGGFEPLWSQDGRTLYFREGPQRERVMAARVLDGESGELGTPKLHLEVGVLLGESPVTGFSCTEEGDVFLTRLYRREPEPVTAIDILLDWRSVTQGLPR